MNRALIITAGIVILLLVLGVWVYLLLFGTPKDSGEVFTNLGFELSSQPVTIAPPIDTQPLETLVDTQSDNPLKQLTTRPVAGFTFASTTQGSVIRYIEQGTGHMYEIDLQTGQEVLRTRTTIPKVHTAVFAPNNTTVALISYEGYTSTVFVGTVDENENLVGISLQPGASNVSFASDTEVLYTLFEDGMLRGYTHNIDTLVRTELFALPYKNFHITWGNTIDGIYATTKPSKYFEGFTYKVQNNTLTPVGTSAYGLSAFITNGYILNTVISNDMYTSNALAPDGTIIALPLLTLKEKCVEDIYTSDIFWCAAPAENTSSTYVEDWYKGIIASDDYVWLVNISTQTAQLYANPQGLAGRSLDITDMQIDPSGEHLGFLNKKDSTLWLFALILK